MNLPRPLLISWLMAPMALAALATGCGGDDAGSSAVQDIPEVPEVEDGDFELVFPEQIIPAGTEKQICLFMPPTTKDRYFKALKAFQGKYGHHFILFKTAVPEAEGSVRDCTESSEMSRLTPVLSSVNFGLESFPEGMAIKVEAGTQMVLQLHYLNTSADDILVRDVMHVTEVEKEDTEVLAGFFGVSDINFRVPVKDKLTLDFECEFPHDMNLLMIGPHMHEFGTAFVSSLGPADALQEVQRIDKWEAEMRDDPPIVEWTKEAPYVVTKGDKVQVRCDFENTTDHPITFPEEMCAAYGYFFPALPGAEEWTCAPGQ